MKSVDRPAFLIIGAMKCGTTSLAESLVRQTNVDFPCGKEPAVLSQRDAQAFAKGAIRYIEQMNGASSDRLVGDASPQSTFRDDLAAERAMEIFGPELKLVYIVRDPVARAVSHFRHAWQGGWQMAPSADKAFEKEPMLFEVSSYRKQLSKWTRVFGESSVLVIRFEDMIKDQASWLERVCEHIGANRADGQMQLEHSNQSGEQGRSIVPKSIWRLLQTLKKLPAVHAIARSSAGLSVKRALMQNDEPPEPSQVTLAKFSQLLESESNQFAQEQGWQPEQYWDLTLTANKLGKG